MKMTIWWDGISPVPIEARGFSVAIGNFDGVHRGHAALLRRLDRLGKRLRCGALAITFDPSPTTILKPSLVIEPLTTLENRLQIIHEYGPDVLVLKTSPALLEMSADDFWNELLVRQLKIKGIVEGRNFCFGKDRQGTIEQLRRWTADQSIPLEVVDDVYRRGLRISSSEIRKVLKQGEVELARRALGRCYSLTGQVVHGEHRGRTIGFPTCNLAEIATLIPKEGVYAARALVNDVWHAAAVNIGPNPTFGVDTRKVEAHLLDFQGDLYGKPLTLEFVARLRDTRKFAGIHELQEQLKLDVEQTRSIVKDYDGRQHHGRR
ncbi:MAG: bifunctional riboflavin kinase/FAD synthetase [Gemmatales bacterium]